MPIPTLPMNWPGKDQESLLWLASYPRSGNTFTRLLLANYFVNGDKAHDINKLAGFCPSDTAQLFWDSYAEIFGAPKTMQETWAARLQFFNYLRKAKDPKAFSGIKTHTGNLEISGSKGFDIPPSDRAIYIVRHPLDVAVSLADFDGVDLDRTIKEMCTSGAYVEDNWPGALEVRGSWSEHVASWYLTPPCPVLLVQYEALLAAPDTALRAILNFIGAPIIEDRLASAVGASHFDKVREQEAAKSFREASHKSSSGTFFRQGKSLQWLKALSAEQAYHLADECGPVMQRVGYAHPRDVFFDGRNAFLTLNPAG